MGSFSIWHWLIVLVIVLLLFGRDRIPKLAGDLAKGIKEFKTGMKDEDKEQEADTAKTVSEEPPTIEGSTGNNAASAETAKDKNVA
jgi:sec-independent protein translocase protein TatA